MVFNINFCLMKSCRCSLLQEFRIVLRIIFVPVVPVTLKPLSLMPNFLKLFQEFNKNSFQHKETPLRGSFLSLQVMQICLWWACNFFFFIIVKKSLATQEFPGANSLLSVRSKINSGVGQRNLWPFPISLIYLCGTKANEDRCFQSDQCRLRVELHNMMK